MAAKIVKLRSFFKLRLSSGEVTMIPPKTVPFFVKLIIETYFNAARPATKKHRN